MSALDEIIKEKQRVSEALARVDAHRDKLASQLSELEATERVLARYSDSPRARRTVSAKTPTTATQASAAAGQSGRRRTTTAKPVGSRRSSPNLNDQVLALATGKTQQEITAACKGAHRRGDCPAQARWPHRRARREALRRTVDGDRATRRVLMPGKRASTSLTPGSHSFSADGP